MDNRKYIWEISFNSNKNNLEKHLLVDSDEFLIPLANVRRPLARIVVVGGVGGW